jgi:hypothetical protein
MAVAELAVAMPALVVVLLCALTGIGVGIDKVRCVDAARVAVRVAARGDAVSVAVGAAQRAAPAGARVSVSAGPDLVTVTVRSARAGPGGLGSFVVDATATAAREASSP